MRISDWSSDVCSSDLVGQLYRGTAMRTLAIHQHKRLIRWQAAHAVRPCENRTVIAGEALDIKRRHLLAQDIGYVRRTLIEQFVRTDDIDRGRGLGSGQIIAARAGHDDLFIPI